MGEISYRDIWEVYQLAVVNYFEILYAFAVV